MNRTTKSRDDVICANPLETIPCCSSCNDPGKPGPPGHRGPPGRPGSCDPCSSCGCCNGMNGSNGSNGLPGANGTNGMNGINAQPGKDGKDGKDGTKGRDGRDGVGIPGQNGQNGMPGNPGANGSNGMPGTNGTNGTNGLPGQNGTNGTDGKDGQDGKDGEPGQNGQDGKDGEPGQNGQDGKDGEPGQNGQDGKDGEPGQNGQDGKDGEPGQNGQDGKDGEPGQNGQDGKDGEPGQNGQDGKDGKDGTSCGCSGGCCPAPPCCEVGPEGPPGPPGPPGPVLGLIYCYTAFVNTAYTGETSVVNNLNEPFKTIDAAVAAILLQPRPPRGQNWTIAVFPCVYDALVLTDEHHHIDFVSIIPHAATILGVTLTGNHVHNSFTGFVISVAAGSAFFAAVTQGNLTIDNCELVSTGLDTTSPLELYGTAVLSLDLQTIGIPTTALTIVLRNNQYTYTGSFVPTIAAETVLSAIQINRQIFNAYNTGSTITEINGKTTFNLLAPTQAAVGTNVAVFSSFAVATGAAYIPFFSTGHIATVNIPATPFNIDMEVSEFLTGSAAGITDGGYTSITNSTLNILSTTATTTVTRVSPALGTVTTNTTIDVLMNGITLNFLPVSPNVLLINTNLGAEVTIAGLLTNNVVSEVPTVLTSGTFKYTNGLGNTGGVTSNTVAVNADYTADINDFLVVATGATTITLPLNPAAGQTYIIVNANPVIPPIPGDTIAVKWNNIIIGTVFSVSPYGATKFIYLPSLETTLGWLQIAQTVIS
jgi:hypothetical protein